LKERRYIDRVPATLLLSEKDSVIALRRINGEMDLVGFFGKGEKSHQWCRDLFNYY
jgi:predicted transcriptional regulator